MEKYIVEKVVGEGSFGKALLCKRKIDNRKCIVKQIALNKMGAKEAKQTEQESALLARLRHPNIVSFWEAFKEVTNSKKCLYIVMEFADGGDLSNLIKSQKGKNMAEKRVINLFVQIALAMKHVHDRKILHRDLKPGNIFLTSSGMIKLGDFGIAKVLNNTGELAATQIGTPYFMSPEILNNQRYSNKTDIWSLGCVLFEMMCLRVPFEGSSMKQLVSNIIHASTPVMPLMYSSELKALVNSMLIKAFKLRPSINTILANPLMRSEISSFLNESLIQNEFNHTVLHGGNILRSDPVPLPGSNNAVGSAARNEHKMEAVNGKVGQIDKIDQRGQVNAIAMRQQQQQQLVHQQHHQNPAAIAVPVKPRAAVPIVVSAPNNPSQNPAPLVKNNDPAFLNHIQMELERLKAQARANIALRAAQEKIEQEKRREEMAAMKQARERKEREIAALREANQRKEREVAALKLEKEKRDREDAQKRVAEERRLRELRMLEQVARDKREAENLVLEREKKLQEKDKNRDRPWREPVVAAPKPARPVKEQGHPPAPAFAAAGKQIKLVEKEKAVPVPPRNIAIVRPPVAQNPAPILNEKNQSPNIGIVNDNNANRDRKSPVVSDAAYERRLKYEMLRAGGQLPVNNNVKNVNPTDHNEVKAASPSVAPSDVARNQRELVKPPHKENNWLGALELQMGALKGNIEKLKAKEGQGPMPTPPSSSPRVPNVVEPPRSVPSPVMSPPNAPVPRVNNQKSDKPWQQKPSPADQKVKAKAKPPSAKMARPPPSKPVAKAKTPALSKEEQASILHERKAKRDQERIALRQFLKQQRNPGNTTNTSELSPPAKDEISAKDAAEQRKIHRAQEAKQLRDFISQQRKLKVANSNKNEIDNNIVYSTPTPSYELHDDDTTESPAKENLIEFFKYEAVPSDIQKEDVFITEIKPVIDVVQSHVSENVSDEDTKNSNLRADVYDDKYDGPEECSHLDGLNQANDLVQRPDDTLVVLPSKIEESRHNASPSTDCTGCLDAITNLFTGREARILPTSPKKISSNTFKSKIEYNEVHEVKSLTADDEDLSEKRNAENSSLETVVEQHLVLRTEESEYEDMLVALAEVLEMTESQGNEVTEDDVGKISDLYPIDEDVNDDGDSRGSAWEMEMEEEEEEEELMGGNDDSNDNDNEDKVEEKFYLRDVDDTSHKVDTPELMHYSNLSDSVDNDSRSYGSNVKSPSKGSKPLSKFMKNLPEKYIEDADDPLVHVVGTRSNWQNQQSYLKNDEDGDIVDEGEGEDWSHDSWDQTSQNYEHEVQEGEEGENGEEEVEEDGRVFDDIEDDCNDVENVIHVNGGYKHDMTVFGVPFPINADDRMNLGLHINESDTPATKIEVLREYLENCLGIEKFIKTYRLLRSFGTNENTVISNEDEDDDDRLLAEVENIIGSDGLQYMDVFMHLISMEENFEKY